jgi:hypothetical protein
LWLPLFEEIVYKPSKRRFGGFKFLVAQDSLLVQLGEPFEFSRNVFFIFNRRGFRLFVRADFIEQRAAVFFADFAAQSAAD